MAKVNISSYIRDKTPCSDIVDKTPVCSLVEEAKKLSKQEIFDLTKSEQFVLLEKLGVSYLKVPRYEKDRVALILKLQ